MALAGQEGSVGGTGWTGRVCWWHWLDRKGLLIVLAGQEGSVGGTGWTGSVCWWYWLDRKGLLVALAGQEGSVGGTGWTGRTEVYNFYSRGFSNSAYSFAIKMPI